MSLAKLKRIDYQKILRCRRFLFTGIWLTCALVAFLYIKPSRMSNPVLRKEVVHADTSFSGQWEEQFEVKDPMPKFQVQTYVEQKNADLIMDLTDGQGFDFLRGLPIKKGYTSFSCGRNIQPGTYTVRIHEANVKGKYIIEIGSKGGVTRWQKFLGLISFLLIVSSVLYFRQWTRKNKDQAGRGYVAFRIFFLSVSLAAFAMFLYLLLHEGGHALASICFGNYDFSRSDFFGLFGSPHSGVRSDIQLMPWQTAIQSFAGPFLPSLAGYILFLLWRTNWAKEFRKGREVIDIFWTFSLFMTLFPHVGTLLPMFGFRADGDYSGFVNNAPFAQWQANSILIVIAIINGYILCRIVPHLLFLKRNVFKKR